jgi:hypothetical protein|tara:strand:+ start:1166 stop:2581 length:1416 start_codon:yes stop_codon:yes gene_type:complete
MLHFYDGQVRRYITQLMRIVSNFPVKDGKDKETIVPVMYGDLTRQVANIIRDNSENKLPSAPRMSVYITALELDKDRLTDASYTRSVNVRERAYDSEAGEYLNSQGANYTVERLIPTPYMMRANVDIWSSNTDQKLQILEQLLVLFNPSLEIQTTDNFIDWTSITVVNLENVQFTNKSIPVGVDSEIDIATLTFSVPIYISPPTKVKKMGVITNVITSMFDETRGTIEQGVSTPEVNQYDDVPKAGAQVNEFGKKAATDIADQMANANYLNYGVYIEGVSAKLISRGVVGGVNWNKIFEAMPGNYLADVSKIHLTNNNNSSNTITGTISLNPFNDNVVNVNWDSDSFPQDTVIDGRTSIDYIIDPTNFDPTGIKTSGVRLLLLDDVGNVSAAQVSAAWKNTDASGLVAKANDIVEWNGTKWIIVFDASATTNVAYTTNLNTSVQYRFTDGEWLLSVDGEYPVGTWRVDLYG